MDFYDDEEYEYASGAGEEIIDSEEEVGGGVAEPEEEDAKPSAGTKDGPPPFRIDSSGRPSLKFPKDNQGNFGDCTTRSLVKSISNYFKPSPSWTNQMFLQPYADTYEIYGKMCSKTGVIPPDFKKFLALQNVAAEVAIALFSAAHEVQKKDFPEHKFIYGQEMDGLVLELIGK